MGAYWDRRNSQGKGSLKDRGRCQTTLIQSSLKDKVDSEVS